MLSSCLTQGPSYGDALDPGPYPAQWALSAYLVCINSLSLVVSTHILPPKVLEQYFCHQLQSDWTVTRVCNWSFFVIFLRFLTVVKSSIGQGIRICSNPSQVVTCFHRFHSHGSQQQSPVLIYNHLILKHLRSQITACKVLFEVFEIPNWIQWFFIKKIQEPATDGFLTKYETPVQHWYNSLATFRSQILHAVNCSDNNTSQSMQ
jgi:hypothetical protein